MKKSAKKKINFSKEIQSSDKKLNSLILKHRETLLAWAKHLGIERIKCCKKQEYDDNNYYSVLYIDKIIVEGNNLVDIDLEYHHISEEMDEAINQIDEIKPSNSAQFILEGKFKNKYELIPREEIANITLGELTFYFLKQGTLEEVRDFLSEILNSREEFLPPEWFED